MLALSVIVTTWARMWSEALLGCVARRLTRLRLRWAQGERGQTSAEYALVLLGAAAVALLVVAWATKTNKVGKLLDAVFDKLLGQVK
jgi:Flp pilus assembly pilin Flp